MQLSTTKEFKLNIIEIFASIQGETRFIGLPTTFIRLAACNLRCTWCDTSYSFGKGTPYSLDDLISQVRESACQNVCVTGGEPLLQENVYPLMSSLCDENYILSLETSGSISVSKVDPRVHIILDIKCPDSGMSHKNLWSNLDLLQFHRDEIKFVIKSYHDYQYAKDICSQYDLKNKVSSLLFSPVHDQLDPKELLSWILKDQLRVRLNVQLHKYIWSPTTRGV